MAETNQAYRVAIIGYGGRAREHVPALKVDGRCRVAAPVVVSLSLVSVSVGLFSIGSVTSDMIVSSSRP